MGRMLFAGVVLALVLAGVPHAAAHTSSSAKPRGLEPICEYAASEIEKLRATEFAPNLRTADRFERLARQKGCTT